jgi:hypothetical protein
MEIRIMPINYSLLFGDAASQTFPATAAGTYTLSTPLAAGLYEITTDTSQSSFTLGFGTDSGYVFNGTIRGGKGYISVPTNSTKIVIPAGMTYPANINIRLGSYTMMSAPTGVSLTLTGGTNGTIAWTNPSGSTDTVAYFRNGTSTSLATTTSPKTSVNIGGATHNNYGNILLVSKDANGLLGLGTEAQSSSTFNIVINGGTITQYSSGGTNYLVNTFTGSGTLNVLSTSTISYLIVAGGGGGGGQGGGGGGGLLTGSVSVPAGSYAVTVGSGGLGQSSSAKGVNGGNSVIAFPSTLTAPGGGGGGTYAGVTSTWVPGANGGCGGGGGMSYYDTGSLAGGTGNPGYNGGNGQEFNYANWKGAGGGGGGMGGVGESATQGNSGDGGNGNGGGRPGNGGLSTNNSIRTGSNVAYAGGGGGYSGGNPTYGNNRTGGGGGAGGSSTAGTANTGGGGGGNAGNGGSGIVVVRVVV